MIHCLRSDCVIHVPHTRTSVRVVRGVAPRVKYAQVGYYIDISAGAEKRFPT